MLDPFCDPSVPRLSAVLVTSFRESLHPRAPLFNVAQKMELGLATLFPQENCFFKNDVGEVRHPTLKGGGAGDRHTSFEKAK